MNRLDDGRRKMPKLKCPHCNKRVIDLPNKELKNNCTLIKTNEICKDDIILKCLHCGKIIGLRTSILRKINNTKCIPIFK